MKKKIFIFITITLVFLLGFVACDSEKEKESETETQASLQEARESEDIIKLVGNIKITVRNHLDKTGRYQMLIDNDSLLEFTKSNTILHITDPFSTTTQKMGISNQFGSPIFLVRLLENNQIETTVLSNSKEKLSIVRHLTDGTETYRKTFADDQSYSIKSFNIETGISETKYYDNQENLLELIQKDSQDIVIFQVHYSEDRSYTETDFNPKTGSTEIRDYDAYKNIKAITQKNETNTIVYSKQYDENRYYSEFFRDSNNGRTQEYRYDNYERLLSLIERTKTGKMIFSQQFNDDRSYEIMEYNTRTKIRTVTQLNRNGSEKEKTITNINNTVIFYQRFNSDRSGKKMIRNQKTGTRTETIFDNQNNPTLITKVNRLGNTFYEKRYQKNRSYTETFTEKTSKRIERYNANKELMSKQLFDHTGNEYYTKVYAKNRLSYTETQVFNNQLKSKVERRANNTLIGGEFTLPNQNTIYFQTFANNDSEIRVQMQAENLIQLSFTNQPIGIDQLLSDQNNSMKIMNKRNGQVYLDISYDSETVQYAIEKPDIAFHRDFKTDPSGKVIYEKEYFADNHSETWVLEPNSTDENTRNLIKQYERTNKKGILITLKEFNEDRSYTFTEIETDGHRTETKHKPDETVIETKVMLPNKLFFLIRNNPDKSGTIKINFPYDENIEYTFPNTVLEIKKRMILGNKEMLVINRVTGNMVVKAEKEGNNAYNIVNMDGNNNKVRDTKLNGSGKILNYINWM